MTAGSDRRSSESVPVKVATICCRADSSDTMYRNSVMSLKPQISLMSLLNARGANARHGTQIERGNCAISLACPLSENKSIRTFATENGP